MVKNVRPDDRRVFKLWEEGAIPCFVLETTSRKTGHEDLGPKMLLYAKLGVREYFLFDPERELFEPALLGYRLVGGGYMPLEMDGTQTLLSEELGILIRLEGFQLGLYDAETGARLLSGEERAEQAEELASQAEERAGQAEERVHAVEAALEQERLARQALEVELAKLRSRTT